eukprot:4925632-Heterocapsa_arctica.AAC.1
MATTRSEIMLAVMVYPRVNTHGNYCAPVCGAPVNPGAKDEANERISSASPSPGVPWQALSPFLS